MSDTKDDDLRYPCRDEVFYGRGVWRMGEEGDEGVVVEGHDRRAWAALNAWCRHEQGINVLSDAAIGLHAELDGPATDRHPRARWWTWHDTCGCSDDQHAEHRFRIREAEESDRPDVEPVEGCADLSDNNDCYSLPPCGDQFAWRADYHDDETARPASASPVLVWLW